MPVGLEGEAPIPAVPSLAGPFATPEVKKRRLGESARQKSLRPCPGIEMSPIPSARGFGKDLRIGRVL